MATAIIAENVSMIFNMSKEKISSAKEYFIKLVKRQLRYEEFTALNNVSFSIEKGDVFGIVGLNGSGKSTLLKIISGIIKPTHGSVTVNGTIAPLIELGAGFDMELTARENIYLNGSVLGYNKKFIDEHFDSIVEFSEMRDFLDVPMKNYSSGMVARVAFAIATVVKPDILIVDEILGVGDYLFQKKCEKRINELMSGGTTVLLVSHNIGQIRSLCKYAIWLEKGIVRATGSVGHVCNLYEGKNPKAVYTAICGGYDDLKNPIVVTEGWDYICFSDDPELKSDFWKVIYWDKETAKENGALHYDNPRKLSKFFKMNPHIVLPEYEETFWIDASFEIRRNTNEYILKYLNDNDILCCKHPERDCIYDEADVCKQLGLDSTQVIDEQIARYHADGYPEHNGLLASGILYRKNTDEMKTLNKLWYDETMKGSVRDQLSFNYCAWKLGFNYDTSDLNYWDNIYFKWCNHNQNIIHDNLSEHLLPQATIDYNVAARIRIEDFIKENPLFKMIQIETYNRCNGECAFCPANKNADIRTPSFMDEALFSKIINELCCEKYSGFVSLFSNNEPFLDKRIFSFAKLTKNMLPDCYLYIMTNGSLLNVEKVIDITHHVDMLIIDNYNKAYELNPNIKEIYDYCDKNEKVRNKVRIQMRIVDQVLTTRGGKAPNRTKIQTLNGITCLNPFEQFVIRPSGKVSLCCCDVYGEYTLGNLNSETLKEIWLGNKYDKIRKKLQIGREQLRLCDGCDVLGSANAMYDGRHITAHWEHLSKL